MDRTLFLIVVSVYGVVVLAVLRLWWADRAPRSDDLAERLRYCHRVVDDLAQRAGITTPPVRLEAPSDTPEPVAYVDWMDAGGSANIVVTPRLLQDYNLDMIKAVLAHEIGHIRNKDDVDFPRALRATYPCYLIIGASTMALPRVCMAYVRGRAPWLLCLLCLLAVLPLDTYLVACVRRYFERRADDYAAELLGPDEDMMIRLAELNLWGAAAKPLSARMRSAIASPWQMLGKADAWLRHDHLRPRQHLRRRRRQFAARQRTARVHGSARLPAWRGLLRGRRTQPLGQRNSAQRPDRAQTTGEARSGPSEPAPHPLRAGTDKQVRGALDLDRDQQLQLAACSSHAAAQHGAGPHRPAISPAKAKAAPTGASSPTSSPPLR